MRMTRGSPRKQADQWQHDISSDITELAACCVNSSEMHEVHRQTSA